MSDRLPFAEMALTGSIAQRFRTIVAAQPDEIAIMADDATLSYADLDRKAASVAHALIARNLPNSGPIAILLPQSAQTIVAILGCLQAGYSFMVLSPTFPQPRLQALMADALSPFVLTNGAHWTQALAIAPAGECCLDLAQLAPIQSSSMKCAPIGADELAALFYTSGTTGEPKGVMWSQQLVLHTARQNQLLYAVAPSDRLAVLTSFGFGAAMTMCFAALLNGAAICLVDQYTADISTLLTQLQQHGVTILGLPPVSLFRQLLDRLDNEQAATAALLPALRLVLLGGQPLRRQDVVRFQQHFTEQVALRYRLAGSETMLMCELAIDRQSCYPDDDLPVGYPVPDKELLLLAEDRTPVGQGEIGEIAICSHYLATGYWQQPDLTAATFLAQPGADGRRLCLTGDMGRLTPAGLLQHLGRKDNMVKIRGYRVQLEAVETALNGLLGINEAAVIARETAAGEKQLIAYYTAATAATTTSSALRNALVDRLPDFMVPAKFIALGKIPRNATGKLDRAALPPPDAARPPLATPFVAPRNAVEGEIAAIWAELLEVEEVGIDDNFFELGGDSLVLLRMILAIEQRLGCSIPAIYYHLPTIAHLAQMVSGGEKPAQMMPFINSTAHARQETNHHQVTKSAREIELHRRFWGRGPTYAGWSMPYALGTVLQRSLLRQPMIQQGFFAQQCRLFRQCLLEAGVLDPDDAQLTLNLMANTWKLWRTQALQSPATFARWVTLHGVAQIDAAIHKGKGLIIVFAHQMIGTRLTRKVLREHGFTDLPAISGIKSITDKAARAASRAQSARHGLDILQRGGVILIAGEGSGATNPVSVPFYGRQLPMPRGFAELAQHSQATVIATFLTMTPEYHLSLEFVPLPTPASVAETDDLLGQYIRMFVERWPQMLPTMGWKRVQYLTSLPHTRGDR